MDLINRYALNRLFTEPLSLLESVNKDELAEHATDAKALYEYLKEKVTGSDMMNFMDSSYHMTILVNSCLMLAKCQMTFS
ncbi:MAG: hypothetical protein ACLR6B_04250 [Blautia sp.]